MSTTPTQELERVVTVVKRLPVAAQRLAIARLEDLIDDHFLMLETTPPEVHGALPDPSIEA